jgi:hypothetical protein
MAAVVVLLYVVEVHGLGDTAVLVEIPHATSEVRVVYDAAEVALGVAVVEGSKRTSVVKKAHSVSETLSPHR